MQKNHTAFRDADIRGVYPTEINEELTYLIARAFVEEYSLRKVVVARDMRHSSPVLEAAFIKGVIDAGGNVLSIGLMDTPGLYYVSGKKNLPGVMITASHSPKNYNGLKLVLPGAIPLTEKHGLHAIRRRIERHAFKEPKKPGKVEYVDIRPKYVQFLTSGLLKTKLSGLKVVIDCGNGMSGPLITELLKKTTTLKATVLFSDLDGSFPNHGSDPTLRKNQRAITATLKSGGNDFGVAFDGDADRIAFFDEKGTFVNSSIIGALIAKRLLVKKPGTKIAYTNLTSRVYEEVIRVCGGKPVITRVGHAFIKESMRQKDIIFGAEHSGHYYYKDYYYTDSAILTLTHVLAVYAEAKAMGKNFSDMIAPYQKYEQTEDTIVMVDDQPKALASALEYLKATQPKRLRKYDGYMVDFGEVWGAIKISVTEPALKMMFEGIRKKAAQQVQDDLAAYIKSIAHG